MAGTGRAVALFFGLAVSGCDQQSPTSPPPSTLPALQVSSLTLTAPEHPLVAGTTVSLKAVARMSDGTDVAVFDGAQWVSDNPDVARVDARGTLDAVREGETTIRVDVKGASASLPVTVLMNMTGVWSITYIPVSCQSFARPPGCEGRHPRPTQRIESVTLFQTGDRISGEWLVPFEGRITGRGRVLLNGKACYTSDHSFDDEIAIEDWQMERTANTESFSGRAHWEEYNLSSWGSCNGTRSRTGMAGELRIIEFRRR